MTKATDTLLIFAALGAVYFALNVGVIPSPQKFHDDILPFLPWWGLVTFGAYALSWLGIGILTFKDKKQKHDELLQQIDEARAFYKSKGINLD
ncbi:hypothetical protein DIURU_003679 [Diutina rugosa]|uniref:Dolichol-phosphate mannosyltransferase subunit 3 n=1 Tax=Diutina rugosa TaxID=5481 RepID=A0A642UPI9_DIURU|nr:uncharacterized protein DIURU_003679 [Diutina rugosa]KAA8900697.1 hypothetical protein DIURU_003679 [Diutina rugosa]